MELDFRLFCRYVGYILQDMEIERLDHEVREDFRKQKEGDDQFQADAAKAREDREAWMRETGKL